MGFFVTLLYIFLFVFCLSVLIMIHELGHLAMAKAFRVYCFEYSIGFGPKLFSFKRKKGETYFSLRAIPFGGFVSMYGEDTAVPEGLEIPPERSLNNVKKYKRALILVAGVTMNALLALSIFFVSNLCFQQVGYYLNPVTISETSILDGTAFEAGDSLYIETVKDSKNKEYYIAAKNGVLTYEDSSTDTGYVGVLKTQLSNDKDLDWKYFLDFYIFDENYNVVKTFDLESDKTVTKVDFTVFAKHKLDDEAEVARECNVSLPIVTNDKGEREFKETGISITKEKYWLGWKAFPKTFVDFGQSATAIVRALGSLFVSAEARSSVGGIIAIGFESTNILRNFGINSFLRVWGMVSVNLAIVNLLPFPGLDGWQLLVLFIEAVARKKMPDKVKTIVSLVGIGLLFALMILLVIKDVLKYII